MGPPPEQHLLPQIGDRLRLIGELRTERSRANGIDPVGSLLSRCYSSAAFSAPHTPQWVRFSRGMRQRQLLNLSSAMGRVFRAYG
jgi:hypothetical protein